MGKATPNALDYHSPPFVPRRHAMPRVFSTPRRARPGCRPARAELAANTSRWRLCIPASEASLSRLPPVTQVLPLLRLGDRVATIDAQVGTGDILRGVRQEEGHRAHQVDRLAHLSLRNQGDPLLLQVRVIVQDLLGAVRRVSWGKGRRTAWRCKPETMARSVRTERSACNRGKCS